MSEREKGLYYSDGSFKDDKQIRKEQILKGERPPIIEGLPEPKNFKDYATIAIQRSKEAKKFFRTAEDKARIIVPDEMIFNFICDLHSYNPYTNHERFFDEIEVIMNTPRSYIFFGGDLIEGIHWGGAGGSEMVGSINEQKGFLRELFKRTKGRVIGAVSGEHDSKWAERTGADPYHSFTELTGAPYKRGVLTLEIEAGDNLYTGLISHKFRGSSIYSNTHPSVRAGREVQGHDYYMAGHTHRKGLTLQPVRSKDGAKMVLFAIGGTYKESGEYSQRQGYVGQKTKQLYGFSIRFNPSERKIEVDEDIIYANKKWG